MYTQIYDACAREGYVHLIILSAINAQIFQIDYIPIDYVKIK